MVSVRRIRTLVGKEFIEHFNSSKLPVMLALVAVAWTANFLIVGRVLTKGGQTQLLPVVVDSLCSHHALSLSLILLFMLSSQLFQKEKQARTLETLLTTAVTPVEVWLAKSLFATGLGVALAGLVCGVVCVVLSVDLGFSVRPSRPAIGFLLLILPGLTGSIVSLLSLAQLLSWNPIVCNVVLMLASMGYFAAANAKPKTFAMSWQMVAAYGLVTTLLLLLATQLGRYATRERMGAT